MSTEIPFNRGLQSTRFKYRERESIEPFLEIMPKYLEGLGKLIDILGGTDTDGVLSLGFSAANMWLDLKTVACNTGLSLPPHMSFVGQKNYNLYADLYTSVPSYKKLEIPFKKPLILEDYSEYGGKISYLNILFTELKISATFVTLLATDQAKFRLLKEDIQPIIAFEEFDNFLFELLSVRRTPYMKF